MGQAWQGQLFQSAVGRVQPQRRLNLAAALPVLLLRCPTACRQIVGLELGPHLETCFRHFILFTLVGVE